MCCRKYHLVFLLFCVLGFDAASQDGQQGYCDDQRRQDEIGRPEEDETDDAGNKGQQGGQTVICAGHLLDQDDDEQSRQGKIDACGIEGDQCPDEGTKDAQDDPIQDGHQGCQHIGPFFIDIFIEIVGAVEGIVFIRQGIDEKIFPETKGAEFFDKGQTVEDMAAIEQQCHDRHGRQGNAAGEEAHHQVLQGACHNEKAAGACPEKIVAHILHQNPIGQTYGDEADEDGEAVLDCIA